MPAPEPSNGSKSRRLGFRRRPTAPESASPPSPPTVLIVDDVEAIRVLLRTVLEPEFTVVGEAGDGAEAVVGAQRFRPDLVVLDLNTPRHDGLEAIGAIHEVSKQTRVVVLSGLDPHLIEDKVLSLGAARFLDKSEPLAELPEALHAALAA